MKNIKTSEPTVDSRDPKEIERDNKEWEEENKRMEKEVMIEDIKKALTIMYVVAFWSIFISSFLYFGYWLVSKSLN